MPPPPPPAVDLVPRLSGYIQAQLSAGLDGDGDGVAPTTSLFIRRAYLRVKGNVLEGVGYTLLLDASTPASLVRDAFASTTLVPHHEIRLGQQKTQFGYENVESDSALYVIDRAFVSNTLGRGQDLRDIGIGVLGKWDLRAGFGVEYALTAVDGAGPNVLADDTPRKNLWGRAGASYQRGDWTVHLGVSGAHGDRFFKADATSGTPASISRFNRFGLDLRADGPWFFAVAEGVTGTDDAGAGTSRAAGYYALVAGKTPWNLGPIARVEAFDPDVLAPGDLLRRYTLGAYADLKPVAARLLINLELDRSEDRRDHALVSWVQVVF